MKRKPTLSEIRLLLQWVEDLSRGEMIESRNYSREYFGFDRDISCDELDAIVSGVNGLLHAIGHDRRISWSAGEIIPHRLRDEQKATV